MAELAVIEKEDTMFDSADENFLDQVVEASFERHSRVDRICDMLHRMLVGESAAALLASGHDHSEDVSIVVLPSWSWLHSRINVGRKDRARDGRRLLLPVRLMWSGSQVQLLEAGRSVEIAWSAAGLGNTGTGSTSITSDPFAWTDDADQGHNIPPREITVDTTPSHLVAARLSDLVADGHTARWEMITEIESQLEAVISRSHASISAEIFGTVEGFNAVMDATGLEAIRDSMSIGVDGDDSTFVTRLIDKCLLPLTFARVEPSRYITVALERDAKAAIRRAIGDPHIGSKIRKLAREVGHTNLDVLLDEYRKRYPADRLSSKRASAALTVMPDPMASRSTFEDIGDEDTIRPVRDLPAFRLHGVTQSDNLRGLKSGHPVPESGLRFNLDERPTVTRPDQAQTGVRQRAKANDETSADARRNEAR